MNNYKSWKIDTTKKFKQLRKKEIFNLKEFKKFKIFNEFIKLEKF